MERRQAGTRQAAAAQRESNARRAYEGLVERSKAGRQTGRHRRTHAHRHTFSRLKPSKQASERPQHTDGRPALLQHSSTYKARQSRPPYACVPPASRCPLACYVLYRPDADWLVSAAGRRFITGTAARIRPAAARFAFKTPEFFSAPRLRRRETFGPARRRRRPGKGKSVVAKLVAVARVWSACVCARRRPRFAEKLIAPGRAQCA